jgi:hypothetical protein
MQAPTIHGLRQSEPQLEFHELEGQRIRRTWHVEDWFRCSSNRAYGRRPAHDIRRVRTS